MASRGSYRLAAHGWLFGEVLELTLEELLQENELLIEIEHEEYLARIQAVEVGVGRAIMQAFGKRPRKLPSFAELRKQLEGSVDPGMASRFWWEKDEDADKTS
jgi:hypothetical protein